MHPGWCTCSQQETGFARGRVLAGWCRRSQVCVRGCEAGSTHLARNIQYGYERFEGRCGVPLYCLQTDTHTHTHSCQGDLSEHLCAHLARRALAYVCLHARVCVCAFACVCVCVCVCTFSATMCRSCVPGTNRNAEQPLRPSVGPRICVPHTHTHIPHKRHAASLWLCTLACLCLCVPEHESCTLCYVLKHVLCASIE